MEKNQLRYTIEVAKYQNMTHAADHLHISQPSISNQILNLEQELGVKLFERSRKRIYLTEAGEFFVKQAQKILNDMDTLKEAMLDMAERPVGRLRVGAPSTMVSLRIPDLLHDFCQINPSIELSLTEQGSFELIKKISLGELDVAFAILVQEKADKELTSIQLMESRIMAVIHTQNPLSQKEYLSLNDLQDQQLIVTTDNFNFQKLLLDSLNKLEIPYHINTVCSQIDTCFALANKNFGITFCSEESVPYYSYDNIVVLPIRELPVRKIYLIYKKNPEYHPVMQAFIEFVNQYYS